MDSSAIQQPNKLSEQERASLLTAIPTYAFTSDGDGSCIYVSGLWSSLLGRREEAMVGTPWSEWVHPDDREDATNQWAQAVLQRKPFSSSHRFVSPDRVVWMAIEARPVWADDERFLGFSGCAREVRPQAMDADLLASQGIAHDLKNIFAVIVGHVDMEHQLGRMDDQASHAILEALVRASELTDELLGAEGARVRTGLNDFVAGVAAALKPMLPKDIRLFIELDAGLDRVPVYSNALWRALANLILNARDAMQTGGEIGIETRRIDGQGGSTLARISVHDTGSGLPEANLDRIFEPYVSTKNRSRVGGLGLAVVRACARLHGGRAYATPRPGSGAAFHVELPLEG